MIHIVNSIYRCVLCKESEESTDHILIHCGKTRELWTVVLSSFGIDLQIVLGLRFEETFYKLRA